MMVDVEKSVVVVDEDACQCLDLALTRREVVMRMKMVRREERGGEGVALY